MWRRIPIDPVLAIVLTVLSVVDVWTQPDRLVPDSTRPALTVAVLLMCLPIAWRRRYPLAMMVAVSAGAILKTVVNGEDSPPDVPLFAYVIAVYSVAAYSTSRRGLVGGAVALAGAVAWGGFILGPAIGAGAWAAGRFVRENRLRADTAERDRDLEAQRAVLLERTRIARELHDVVSHAMSTVIVQAGAERLVLAPDQERTRAVLAEIERTGREAMIEMRRLLGLLRDGQVELSLRPQPGLDQLGPLAEQMRASGLDVEVHVDGTPIPLPPGVDVSAYRIVQEALTNVLRHARANRAEVAVRYQNGDVELEVTDDGRGGEPSAGGHGLIGMSERAALFGGELDAGPLPQGGFAVRARLPVEGA
jgi:signal transduction histidine kinase